MLFLCVLVCSVYRIIKSRYMCCIMLPQCVCMCGITQVCVCVFQVLAQIEDKQRRLPEVRACQGGTSNTSTLQRLMQTFEHDIQLLVAQVN